MNKHSNSRVNCWRNPAPNAAAAKRRAERIAEGERQRRDEAESFLHELGRPAATHSELMLPILRLLDEAGTASPADLYDTLVNRLGLDPGVRGADATGGFDRTVRWAMQEGKRKGLMEAPRRGRWRATADGVEALGKVRTGMRVTVFRTAMGEAVAAMAEEASAIIDPGSVQLLFTSPLFPLLKAKSYGSMEPADWLPWMMDHLESWLPLMRDDGVMVLHLGQVHYRGTPAISSYRERLVIAAQDRLGLYQHQPFFWQQPSRKATQEWGAVRGMLPNGTVDPLYVLSKSSMPFLDVRQALVPYADANDVRRAVAGRKEMRPSGQDWGASSYVERGGARPGNLIVAGGVNGADASRRAAKAAGLPPHPCPMPIEVPRHVIRLTTKPGDLVMDPFFGSGTTGAAAEEEGRRWLGIDHHRLFLEGAAMRPQFNRGGIDG